MRHLAAAVLIQLAGKTPDEESIKKVLREAGAKVDEGKLKAFVGKIHGKNVLDLAKQGLTKLGSGKASAPVSEPKKEEKKEEKKPPKKEEKPVVVEEEEVGVGDLFGF